MTAAGDTSSTLPDPNSYTCMRRESTWAKRRNVPPGGPHACRAAVSVTFDNLGEAADLERGLWPEGEPSGATTR